MVETMEVRINITTKNRKNKTKLLAMFHDEETIKTKHISTLTF